jgi:anaerobic selenocysteine-containing dehydrogenase
VSAEAAIGEPVPATRTVNLGGLARAVRELREPRIEALFVYNCNPAATLPDQRAVVEQLRRDDVFVVVHEQVMTDTAALADVVLPATTFLEHRELRRGYGTMRMFDSGPVVPPAGEARSNNQLFGALLERFGLVRAGEAMSDDDLVAATFAAAPQLARALRADTIASVPPAMAFVDVFPDTADGKIHLVPSALDVPAGSLYTYREDPATPAYPLAMISPALATQISSTFGQLRDAPGELELSPVDAAARGIRTGDRIRVWNDCGEVHCLAKVSPAQRAGVCSLPKGLWRKHTTNGFTANALIPQAFADLAGQVAYNDARVEVARTRS